ncbi:MAG: recombinase XerC [Rickettsiales bacterium]|nr:recombinase XerC [Rickettsiales bacterium]
MDNDLKLISIQWVDWIKSEKRLSVNTVESYSRDVFHFLKHLSEYKNLEISFREISMLNQDDLTSWFFKRLNNGVSHRSNSRSLSSIKSFLKFLIRNKKIKSSKLLRIRGPRFSGSMPRPLSKNQINRLIEDISKESEKWIMMRNLSIIILMWGYGLRISEVINLKLKDLETNNLTIIGKGQKSRIIPILDEVILFLKKLIEICPHSISYNDYIFLGKRGKQLKASIIQKKIRAIRNKLNFPENTTPHSLRHTFATELLENMVDLRSIQELLGHSSLSTTQKYTKVTSEKMRSVIEKNHPRAS